MIEPITQRQMHRDYSIMDAVVRSGLTLDQLSGPERTKPVYTKRHRAIARLVKLHGFSEAGAGRVFNRDQTSVRNSIERAGL